MLLELRCPCCGCHLSGSPETPSEDILDRMTDDGPWFALAEGDTFADMIEAALSSRGAIHCPDCCGVVAVREASLAACDRELVACY